MSRSGVRKGNYDNCGRKPWKVPPLGRGQTELVRKSVCSPQGLRCEPLLWQVTRSVRKFLVKRLLELRTKCVCRASTLQRELLKAKRVQLSTRAIQKVTLHDASSLRSRLRMIQAEIETKIFLND